MSAVLQTVRTGQDQVAAWGMDGPPEAPAPRRDQERLARKIGPAAFNLTTAGVIRCENAMAEARTRSDLGLEMWAETVRYQLVASEGEDPGSAAVRIAAMEPIGLAIAYETNRRAGLRRRGVVPSTAPSAKYEALRALIAEVKASVQMVDVLYTDTMLRPVVSGKTETHAPCPQCGGRDRFIITHGPPSLGYCRRCEWGCDVLSFAATIWGLDLSNGDDLRECAVRLAREYMGTIGEGV